MSISASTGTEHGAVASKPGHRDTERRNSERRMFSDRRAEARFEPSKLNRRSGRGRRGLEVLGLC